MSGEMFTRDTTCGALSYYAAEQDTSADRMEMKPDGIYFPDGTCMKTAPPAPRFYIKEKAKTGSKKEVKADDVVVFDDIPFKPEQYNAALKSVHLHFDNGDHHIKELWQDILEIGKPVKKSDGKWKITVKVHSRLYDDEKKNTFSYSVRVLLIATNIPS